MSDGPEGLAEQVLGAVRGTPLLVLLFDRDGDLTWLNPAAQEALGHGDAPAGPVLSEPLPSLEGSLGRAEGDFTLVRADGGSLHVRGRLSRVRDAGGRLSGTALVASDTAPGAEWHHELLRGTLPAAMGMMGAEVAHKVNNPSTWLRLNVDQLRADLDLPGGLEPELARELLDECREGLARIAQIAAELRTLAAPTEDELRDTDLREVVAAACSLAPLTPEGRVSVRRDLAQVPRLRLAAGRVGQAIWSLLSLCVRSAAPGASPPTLRVQLDDDGEHIYVDLRVDRPLTLSDEALHPGARSRGPAALRMARTVLAAHGGLVMPVPEGHGLRLRLPIVIPEVPLV